MKKKKKKLLKPTYRKFLIKRSVWIFNRRIVYRDSHTCVVCWSKTNPTAWHFVSALCAILRYSEINTHCQCSTCNYKHEFDPLPYSLWMIQNYWVEQLTTLKDKRGSSYKWSLSELENICIDYGNKLLQLSIKPEEHKNIDLVLKRIAEYNI